MVLPATENPAADERQAQLRSIASDLLYWKGGLKVLRQAQLPKWRGSFKWQIEAKIEALQAAYARLRAEAAQKETALKRRVARGVTGQKGAHGDLPYRVPGKHWRLPALTVRE